MHKTLNEIFMTDVAIPGESRISQKTVEKLTNYVDLNIEVSRLWNPRKFLWFQLLLVHLALLLLIFAQLYGVTQFAILFDYNISVVFRTSSILRQYLQI